MYQTPCELILKVGSNEYDQISAAIISLLRSCSISEQTFFLLERQVHATAYSGSFTHSSSLPPSIPIPSQSLSCVLLLTDDILKQKQLIRPQNLSANLHGSKSIPIGVQLPKSKYFFKSAQIWNFHHKIELLDDKKQSIARQDYYELSQFLPLWSVSHIPHSRHPIVRFNVFTQHFDSLLTFYTRLFQSVPDSSKPGFALFILPTPSHMKIIYQFSIKYSPSIQPYSIAQTTYLKFRLSHLDRFLSEYTSKLFKLNQFEYYIYDPDGNLLHLQLFDRSNEINREDFLLSRPVNHRIDSGMGESSDPPTANKQIFSSTVPQGYKPFYPIQDRRTEKGPTQADIDVESHSSQSSHDSGRWSSVSSNDVNSHNRARRIAHPNENGITKTSTPRRMAGAVASARKSEQQLAQAIHNYRLKQQQQSQIGDARIPTSRIQHVKSSIYDSEPRLSTVSAVTNRYYSSMTDVQPTHENRISVNVRSIPTRLKHHTHLQPIHDQECDISYEVDSPRDGDEPGMLGYLNVFLMKKRQEQQAMRASHVQQLIEQFDKPNTLPPIRRPLSAPLVDQTSKPTKSILQRRPNSTVTPTASKSLRKRSKSVTFECHSDDENDQATSDTEEEKIQCSIENRTRGPRINIGITLDSRLRRTPALDMLRSTTMETEPLPKPNDLNRTNSFRQTFLPMARF